MIRKKLTEAIERLNLDLTGTTVLTEAATGAYAVTAVLAAAAGARVFAYSRDTKYGSVAEARRQVNELARSLNTQVGFLDSLTPEIIGSADIITNSGHLRPLDAAKLEYVKNTAVIPLMYESWEIRDSDIDFAYCKKRKIKIGATNERHPDIDVFNFLGDMALKLIFDSGQCVYKNKFILICNNDFGPFIARTLSKVCSGLAVCDLENHRDSYGGLNIDWIGNFPDFTVPDSYRDAAAVIFTAYPFDKTWIGESGPLPVDRLKSQVNNPIILRFAGDIDEAVFKKHDLSCYPAVVRSGHMGILPSDIGFDPIIRLQSGGLKAGELMWKGEKDFHGEQLVDLI